MPYLPSGCSYRRREDEEEEEEEDDEEEGKEEEEEEIQRRVGRVLVSIPNLPGFRPGARH
jgi:hypothetical protein